MSDEAPPTPFFRTPEPARPYARRLLVVSGHFPPSRAVGGLRWQKMSHFAAARGWGTDVICLDPSLMRDQDPERLNDLPPGLRIFGAPHPGPVGDRAIQIAIGAARRFRSRPAPGEPEATRAGVGESAKATGASAPADDFGPTATGSVARRDVRRFRPWAPADVVRALTAASWIGGDLRWAGEVVSVGRRVLGPEHRAIVTSGPPHFAHEAGRRLSRLTGLPHVADFRDPWSVTERVPIGFATPAYFALVSRYERRVVANASLVVANTELAARAMRGAYPAFAERIVTVMNGSDDEAPPKVERDARFLVAYTGAIYFDRDPRVLFRAGARVIRELGLTPDTIGFELMGPVDEMSPSVMQLARQEGVEPFVRYHPAGPRSAAARLLASASLLVSLPQDTETAIPSKIFEYSTYDAWLLALARQGSASALVLEGSGADVVAPDDVGGIADVLRRHYGEFAAGVRPRAVGGDGRFSRARQAALLLDHLDRIAAPAR